MEESVLLMGNQRTFTTPSGHTITVREQNGEDEEILSNSNDAKNLDNINKYIASVIIDNDYQDKKRLSLDQVRKLPALDRWAIMINSRINSLGNILVFNHKWVREDESVEELEYSQDIDEFLFDYSETPSKEELLKKPNAIPYYPNPEMMIDIPLIDIPFNIGDSEFLFDRLTGETEVELLKATLDHPNINEGLKARNLRLKVNGNYEKVTSFSMFPSRIMGQIREKVYSMDPSWNAEFEIIDPKTNQTAKEYLMVIPSFFYLGAI